MEDLFNAVDKTNTVASASLLTWRYSKSGDI